jgi:heme-degrading monooxygenase HmoA
MIVVLFSTTPSDDLDVEDFQRTSARMRELVTTIPGFISYNSYPGQDQETVAIVRFDSEEALDAWRSQPEHLQAQEKGRRSYFKEYWIQVCSIVREYRFVDDRYERDLRTMFVGDSAIRAATWAPS